MHHAIAHPSFGVCEATQYDNREEWLKARRTGIGGSDVAAILGASKWQTPTSIYMAKLGEAPQQSSDALEWGTRLEPVIRAKFSSTLSAENRVESYDFAIFRNIARPWLIASLDGIVWHVEHGPVALFEAKTARTSEGWGDSGTDEIPDYYYAQVQHCLHVTGLPVCYVAVLIGGSDYRCYTIHRDDALYADIIPALRAFWDCVEARTPPPVTTADEAVARWGRSHGAGKIEASPAAAEAVAELSRIRDELKALEARESELKAVLMAELADRGDVLTVGGEPAVSWKLTKGRTSFDTTAFKSAHPALYAEFTREGEPSRRFLLK